MPHVHGYYPPQACTYVHMFFTHFHINAQLSKKQMCICHTHRTRIQAHLFATHLRIGAQLSEKQLCTMHSCISNRRASNVHLLSSLMHPHACLSSLQPCTLAWVSFDRPCTGGPTLTKSHNMAICTTLPRKETLTTMQEDETTNLDLANTGLASSNSQNLQISSENLSSTHHCSRYK
jgi:hypothetical protein